MKNLKGSALPADPKNMKFKKIQKISKTIFEKKKINRVPAFRRAEIVGKWFVGLWGCGLWFVGLLFCWPGGLCC